MNDTILLVPIYPVDGPETIIQIDPYTMEETGTFPNIQKAIYHVRDMVNDIGADTVEDYTSEIEETIDNQLGIGVNIEAVPDVYIEEKQLNGLDALVATIEFMVDEVHADEISDETGKQVYDIAYSVNNEVHYHYLLLNVNTPDLEIKEIIQDCMLAYEEGEEDSFFILYQMILDAKQIKHERR